MKQKEIPIFAVIAIISACFFWAGSFIATKIALKSIPPVTVVSLRLIVSALGFIVWMKIKGVNLNRIRKYRSRLFVLSLFGTGLHYGIQTMGLQFTTASKGGIYAVTAPITITVIAAIFLKEKITIKKVFGIFLAIIGVLIVMGLENISNFNLKGDITGDILILASIFMWGIFTILGKSLTKKIGPLEITGVITIIGALYMIPPGIYNMVRSKFTISGISYDSILAVIFLGLTCSFLATLLYVYALSKMESQKVGVYLYTIPPITSVIAFLILKEPIGYSMIVGSGLVLFGVYITERG